MHTLLDNRHCTEKNYVQRITQKQCRRILLDSGDKVIYKGKEYSLYFRDVGYGVVEVGKVVEDNSTYNIYDHEVPDFDYLAFP